MAKLLDKFKCAPLGCLTFYFLVSLVFWGWLKADVIELRQMQFKILELQAKKIALEATPRLNLALRPFLPYSTAER